MSKLDQLKELGAATRARKNTPEASGTARKAPSGSLLGDPSRSTARASSIASVEQRPARQSHKLEVEGSNPSRATKHPVAKEPEASGHNRLDGPRGTSHRGSSRLGAGRTAQDAATPSGVGRVAIQAECPVCAARRMARAAAQKKWRKGKAK